MKFTTTAAKTTLGAVGVGAVGLFTAATALAAPPNVQGFGVSEKLMDGPLVTNYMVTNLRPAA